MHLYLWAKYFEAKSLPMVPWDVHIVPKDEGGLTLIDVVIQTKIFVPTCVVKCLDGTSPWKVLRQHKLLSTQHIDKVRDPFGLCDIISSPHNL